MEKELKEIIKKYALKNKVEYGKISPKSVIAKVIAEKPELKTKIKEIIPIINTTIKEINKLSLDEAKELLSIYKFDKPKKENKIWIENPKEGVVTRFPPEPSGYLHLGHAKALFLNEKIATDYKGFMLLRFDDTNPKKCGWNFVDAIKEDVDWLGAKYKNITFTSDYIKLILEKLKKLIELGYAYTTKASQEEIKKMREGKMLLQEREYDPTYHLEIFEKILENTFKEGEVTILLKGNLKSTNTSLRDPTLARIIETPHYRIRDKNILWPTYDLAAPIVDSVEGITHAIRSKEYEIRTKLYYLILDMLKMRKPTLMHFSRLNIEGYPLSKRMLRKLVEEKIVDGWDDERMPTIRGIKRRGILPKAIKDFSLRFGIGKQETKVSIKMLEEINREYIKENISCVGLYEPKKIELRKNNEAMMVWVEKKYSNMDKFYLPKIGVVEKTQNGVFNVKDMPISKEIEKTVWTNKKIHKTKIYTLNHLVNENGEILNKKYAKIEEIYIDVNPTDIKENYIVKINSKYYKKINNNLTYVC